MRRLTAFIVFALLACNLSMAAADEPGGMKDKKAETPATPDWDVAFGSSVVSDYVFRGLSQSNRWPSGWTYTELRYNPKPNLQFYSGIGTESIDFPNRATAEVDFYGGVRPTFDKLSFDVGGWYYWYPGGRLFNGAGPVGPNPNCTNGFKLAGGCNIYEADLSFWEVFAKTTYAPNDKLTLGANVFSSPSWLAEGASGTYTSLTAKVILPSTYLPTNVGAFILAEYGHYFFGRTDEFYGNIELPEYNFWNAGLAFTYKVFTLDLRYYDTDLSRGDCNVLTSDHTATFNSNNISSINPSGLGSSWCGSAFVAKLSVDMTVNTNLK